MADEDRYRLPNFDRIREALHIVAEELCRIKNIPLIREAYKAQSQRQNAATTPANNQSVATQESTGEMRELLNEFKEFRKEFIAEMKDKSNETVPNRPRLSNGLEGSQSNPLSLAAIAGSSSSWLT